MRKKNKYFDLYLFLEGFEESNIIDVYNQIMFDWTEEQINDFVVTLFNLIPNDFFDKESYYNFFANSTLAGEPYPCESLECRMKNINELARFSALYADKVLIQSPFDKHRERVDSGKKISREVLVGDIFVVLNLKPLVLNGIMGFFSSYICLCNNCMKKIVRKEEELRESLEHISKIMYKETLENIKCTLQRGTDGTAYVSIRGAEKLGFHEQVDILFLKEEELISNMLRKSKSVNLTARAMKKMGIIEYIFEPLINDVFQAQINTSIMESSYITNRTYDVDMISKVQQARAGCKKNGNNKFVKNGFFHSVPLVGEVDIRNIVKLRKSEEDIFNSYRSKMNSVLNEYDMIDRTAIRDIHRDIIQPELDLIEGSIVRNKKALIKTVAQDLVLLGGGLGIGKFTEVFPLDYKALVSVMGGIPLVADVCDKTRKCISGYELKGNSYYFLYELEKRYLKK